MEAPDRTPDEWRRLAGDFRAQAAAERDPERRAMLLNLAAGYEMIADWDERKARGSV